MQLSKSQTEMTPPDTHALIKVRIACPDRVGIWEGTRISRAGQDRIWGDPRELRVRTQDYPKSEVRDLTL